MPDTTNTITTPAITALINQANRQGERLVDSSSLGVTLLPADVRQTGVLVLQLARELQRVVTVMEVYNAASKKITTTTWPHQG